MDGDLNGSLFMRSLLILQWSIPSFYFFLSITSLGLVTVECFAFVFYFIIIRLLDKTVKGI